MEYVELAPVGNLNFAQFSEFKENCKKVITENPGKSILLNLQDVNYISSSGIKILVNIQKDLLKDGLEIVIIKPNMLCESVLNILKVNQMIKVYKTRKEFINDKL